MITKDAKSVQSNRLKLYLASITSESLILGVLLAIVGGFLDAYTFIGRGGVFANAQTGNMVIVGVEAFKGNIVQALLHALPIVAFIAGVVIAEHIKINNSTLFLHDCESTILTFEIGILFIVGFINNASLNTIVTAIISFVTSLQYCAFKRLGSSPYATTMCTGNLRSASQAAYNAFMKKDHDAAVKAINYFAIIFSFILGAALGGLFTISIGVRAVWGSAILLFIPLIILNITIEEEEAEEENEAGVI